MKKYTGQEWAFFRNRAGRIQFNSVCRSCRNRCKQSFRAEILSCRRYESRKRRWETPEIGTNYPRLVQTEKEYTKPQQNFTQSRW